MEKVQESVFIDILFIEDLKKSFGFKDRFNQQTKYEFESKLSLKLL